jgi:outer membrane lipoprotein-sorting protein
MIRKNIYLILLLLLTFQFTSAQNNAQAERILTDLLTSAKTSAIKTNFKLIVREKTNSQPQISEGTFTLKGNKFVLELEEMKAWFDGKTQWSYVLQNNEVSITEPTEKELAETNPMAILSGFKTKCLIRFSAKIKSDQNYFIEMIPRDKKNDITKIDVQVNKTNRNLFSIKLTNRNGSISTLTLTDFQKGLNVSDHLFVFNANKYKGVVVNDLR